MLWKGTLQFGLIKAPVALYAATRRNDIQLDMIDRRTQRPVGIKRINKDTGEEVANEDIVRGYRFEDNHYVTLSDEELREASGMKASHTVELRSFTEARELSFMLFETPYYLAPAPGGEKIYALLREALTRRRKIGIAKLIVQTRQHLAALVAYGPVLVLNTLRWADQIQPYDELSLPAPALEAQGIHNRELAMAEQLIERMTEPWNPNAHRDTFKDDVLALIERKLHETGVPELHDLASPDDAEGLTSVDDLTDILDRSLVHRAEKRKPALPPTRH
jgi:DNA end-binding protein Ku